MTEQAAELAPEKDRAEKSRPRRRWLRYLKRFGGALLALAATCGVILLVGLIPVNRGFAPAADGVTIHVASTAVHADLILPLVTDVIDWREEFPPDAFPSDAMWATHIAIGWGDRGFYLETPTWADLKASTAAKALLRPSASCLHVALTTNHRLSDAVRDVTISREQYQRLVRFILANFRTSDDGAKLLIPDATYYGTDVFFEARGAYHFLNTCNSWIGRALQSAGVCTPWLTPLPRTVFLYWPES